MINSTNIFTDTLPAAWKIQRIIAGCSNCHRAFLISETDSGIICPICSQGKLERSSSLFRNEPPEKFVPAVINTKQAAPLLERFVNEVKLRCDDFNIEQLNSRMKMLYLPMWLVDATLSGKWEATAGFPQQVKSSVENFSSGSWESKEIIETKLFWEKRIGDISRRYENIAVPANTEFENYISNMTDFDLNQSIPYSPSFSPSVIIAVPNIEPETAWQKAQPEFERQALNNVLTACGANEVRDYHLTPIFEDFNWTQILLPVLSTFYMDDDGDRHVIFINGQSGIIRGKRIASQRKGFLYAGIAFAIAVATFLLGLGAFALTPIIPPLSFLGLVFIPIAIIATIIAGYFMILPWQWNQAQKQQEG